MRSARTNDASVVPVETAESPPPQLSDTLKKLFPHNKIAIALSQTLRYA
ncbi:hypothetical protein QUA07_02585 [Microcoleus sp. T3_A4]